MTEEEAKTKWCPMGRKAEYTTNGVTGIKYTTNGVTGINMEKSGLFATRCQASACMMWRKNRLSEADGGYCGLAGKP